VKRQRAHGLGGSSSVKPKQSPDEGPVDASRTIRFGQTGVIGDQKGLTFQKVRESRVESLVLRQTKDVGSCTSGRKANEVRFIARIRQASLKDADLIRNVIRKSRINRNVVQKSMGIYLHGRQ